MNSYSVTINIPAINRETAEKLLELKMKWADMPVNYDLAGLAQAVADACIAKVIAQNKLLVESNPGIDLENYKPVHKITVMVPANSYAEAQDKIRAIFSISAIPVKIGMGVLVGIIVTALLLDNLSKNINHEAFKRISYYRKAKNLSRLREKNRS